MLRRAIRRPVIVVTPSNPSKHYTLNQCWFNAGPASQTLDQHQNNIGSTSCYVGRPVSVNTKRLLNVVIMLGQHRRRWTNIEPHREKVFLSLFSREFSVSQYFQLRSRIFRVFKFSRISDFGTFHEV